MFFIDTAYTLQQNSRKLVQSGETMEWVLNLRVNTTCAMMVQVTNTRSAYHDVLSHLFGMVMREVMTYRVHKS